MGNTIWWGPAVTYFFKGNIMAHTRKDTYCKTTEWWKHLRPFNKRRQAKMERKAAKKRIHSDEKEMS
jgi:hypothetical protein